MVLLIWVKLRGRITFFFFRFLWARSLHASPSYKNIVLLKRLLDILAYSKLNGISFFVAFWQIAYFTKRGHNVCKDTFSLLFPLPNPIHNTGRQSHIWSYSLGLWGARSSFSLLNPAGFGFFFSCLICPLPFYTWAVCIMMQHKHSLYWDRAVHGNFGWLLYDELLSFNEFTAILRMVFFNTFDLKVVVKYDEVLCQFISQLGYRCSFKAIQ